MIDWTRVRPGTTMMWLDATSDEGDLGRTVPNAIHSSVREDTLLVEISPVARLLDQRRWKAMRICLVMGQLMVHEIIDL